MEQNIQLVISIMTLLAMIFAIYKYFRDPDIKSAEAIRIINERCRLKHDFLDENIVMIKENHLKHLETDVAQLKNDITKILTILEERFKK
jgi:hypothetical protein